MSFSDQVKIVILIKTTAFLIILLLNNNKVSGHATMLDPPNRSSLWRLAEFSQQVINRTINTDDIQQYCGGYTVQHNENKGKCGVCGDNYLQPRPRDNESGGKYDIGTITRIYKSGSVINTTSLITANHLGHFEFSLCVRNSRWELEEDSCFEKYPLPLSNGKGTKSFPVLIGQTKGLFNVSVRLPPRVTCSHCVIRWEYITGNRWGVCGFHNTSEGLVEFGELGCGPQIENLSTGCSGSSRLLIQFYVYAPILAKRFKFFPALFKIKSSAIFSLLIYARNALRSSLTLSYLQFHFEKR